MRASSSYRTRRATPSWRLLQRQFGVGRAAARKTPPSSQIVGDDFDAGSMTGIDLRIPSALELLERQPDVLANCRMEERPERLASCRKRSILLGSEPLRRPRNRIASRRNSTKLGDAFFNAITFAASSGVSVGVGFMQRDAATVGEICHPVAGSTAQDSPSGSLFGGGDGCVGARLVALSRLRQVDSNRSRWDELPRYPRRRMSWKSRRPTRSPSAHRRARNSWK